MSYKGYYGSVEFSEDDNVFHGRIIGINDLISYEGECVKSLRRDFEESVDEYFEVCSKIGKEPDKVYKGSFNVRIEAELHRKAVLSAAALGTSLNSFVEEAIRKYITE